MDYSTKEDSPITELLPSVSTLLHMGTVILMASLTHRNALLRWWENQTGKPFFTPLHAHLSLLASASMFDREDCKGLVSFLVSFRNQIHEPIPNLIQPRRYVALSSEEIKAMLEQVAKPVPRLSSSDLLKASLSGDQAVWLDPDVEQLLAGMTRSKEFPLPQGLQVGYA